MSSEIVSLLQNLERMTEKEIYRFDEEGSSPNSVGIPP